MKKAAMVGGIALMFLATAMMASAYHVPEGNGARNWVNPGTGLVIVACEDPAEEQPGIGGLCYASSQHADEAQKKAKKDNLTDSEGNQMWSAVEPKRDDGVEAGTWFARINSNTRSCTGTFGQAFFYKEVIAYWGGALPNANGVSGHVTFFIDQPDGLTGTYNGFKDVDETAIDDTKTAVLCTGNGVGLGPAPAK